MTDELTRRSFTELTGSRAMTDGQANTIVSRSRLAWMTLDRVYKLVQGSDMKMNLFDGQENILDSYRQQVSGLLQVSGRKLLEGEHIPVESPAKEPRWKRFLPDKLKGRKPLALPESSAAAQPEIVSFISPEEAQAMATASAQSGVLLCHALIGNILHNYDYHLEQWKTKNGRAALSHPRSMLEYLLITYVGLNGEPEGRLIAALEQKTGIETDKWNKLVKKCLDDNKKQLHAESVLDVLSSSGPARY